MATLILPESGETVPLLGASEAHISMPYPLAEKISTLQDLFNGSQSRMSCLLDAYRRSSHPFDLPEGTQARQGMLSASVVFRAQGWADRNIQLKILQLDSVYIAANFQSVSTQGAHLTWIN